MQPTGLSPWAQQTENKRQQAIKAFLVVIVVFSIWLWYWLAIQDNNGVIKGTILAIVIIAALILLVSGGGRLLVSRQRSKQKAWQAAGNPPYYYASIPSTLLAQSATDARGVVIGKLTCNSQGLDWNTVQKGSPKSTINWNYSDIQSFNLTPVHNLPIFSATKLAYLHIVMKNNQELDMSISDPEGLEDQIKKYSL